jgi:uncharacterized protein
VRLNRPCILTHGASILTIIINVPTALGRVHHVTEASNLEGGTTCPSQSSDGSKSPGRTGQPCRGSTRSYSAWTVNDAGDGSSYGLVDAGEKGIAGGIGASQDGGSGGVTFYVEVDDPAAYLTQAEKLGGATVVPPTEIPNFGLTFAFFADPEGHLVGLSKGAIR